MAERIADYCDAILVIESLCKPGYKCCVSRDIFGDSPPPELQVIDRTNSSRYDEKKGDKPSNKISSTTIRPNASLSTSISATSATTMTTMTAISKQPTTTMMSTIAATTRPKPALSNPCKGECTSDLSAFFCNNIDGDADCPADGSVLTVCCINEPPPQKTVIKFTT